jgi:hypothetical protein
MVNTKITEKDSFLDMPPTARLLYYDLLVRADDDGFITPYHVIRMTGASADDLKILIAKQFLYQWNDGVIVLLHWREHNNVKADRYQSSEYSPRLRQIAKLYVLGARDNGSKMVPKRFQNGSILVPQDRLGKDRLVEDTNTPLPPTVDGVENIQEMKNLWKDLVGTTLRNHVEENLKAYTSLKKDFTDLNTLLKAVRMIRADVYQPRNLQNKLINYVGLKEKIEEVEAFIQVKVDQKHISNSKILEAS